MRRDSSVYLGMANGKVISSFYSPTVGTSIQSAADRLGDAFSHVVHTGPAIEQDAVGPLCPLCLSKPAFEMMILLWQN